MSRLKRTNRSTDLRRLAAVVGTALLLLGAIAAAPVSAADAVDTIHVDDDWSSTTQGDTVGGGYEFGTNATASIQDAIDLASAGDTIVVHDGTYDPITVTEQLTLEAADGATPTISGSGAALVQLEGSADGARLAGFELTGDATLGVEARANDLELVDNVISVATTGIQIQDDADGTGPATGALVEDNTITGGLVGVSLTGGTHTVTANTITGFSQEGIGAVGASHDLSGNADIDGQSSAPDVAFYGSLDDEVAAANAYLADGAIDSVSVIQSGHRYDGAIVADGTVYATLQQAVDTAPAQSTVTIEKSGTYAGFSIQENLTVTAAPGVDAVIDADAGVGHDGRVVEVGHGSDRATGATLSNVTVDATGQSTYMVGVSISANHSTIRDVTVIGDSQVTGIQSTSDTTEGVLLTENTVEGANVGISLQAGNDVATDNTITGAILEGFGIAGDAHKLSGNDVTTAIDAPAVRLYGALASINGENADWQTKASAILADNPDLDTVAISTSGDTYRRALERDGTYYSNLQSFVDDASQGETINLGAGTYEGVTLNVEGVTLTGAGDDTVIAGRINLTADDTSVRDVKVGNADTTFTGRTALVTLRGNDTLATGLTIANDFARERDAGGDITIVGENAVLRDSTITRPDHTGGASDPSGAARMTAVVVGKYHTQDASGNWAYDGADGVVVQNVTITNGDVSGYVTEDGSLTVTENAITPMTGDVDAVWVTGLSYAPVPDSATVTIGDNGQAATVTETVQGFVKAYTTVNAAFSDTQGHVADGGTVHIAPGTHDVSDGNPLVIDVPNVTVVGAGQSQSTLDASESTWYGVKVHVDGVEFGQLTLEGPRGDIESDPWDNYGVHWGNGEEYVSADVHDLTVRGSGSNELDLIAVRDASIRDVTLEGEDTAGAGLGLSDVINVSATDVTTDGNQWGGVAVMTNGQYGVPAQTTNVTVSGLTHDGPAAPIYLDPKNDGRMDNFSDLSFPDHDYRVVADDFRDGDFTWYFDSQDSATSFAEAMAPVDTGDIPSWEDAAAEHPVVENYRTSTFVVTDPLSIQAAIDHAESGDTIDVYPGEFEESALNRGAENPDEIQSQNGAYRYGLYVPVDDLTIRGVTADGTPITDVSNVEANVVAQNNSVFGTNGVYVAGDGVTIQGLELTPDPDARPNKNVEVSGDDFTLRHSLVHSEGASVYFNTGGMQSFTVASNNLTGSISISNGVGNQTAATNRVIENNDVGAIGWQGQVADIPWMNYQVGDAIITGNHVHGTMSAIGQTADIDFQAHLANNEFDHAATLHGPGGDLKSTNYTISWDTNGDGENDTITHYRVISDDIQSQVDRAESGDTVLLHTGTFTGTVNVTDTSNFAIVAPEDSDATLEPTSTIGVEAGGYGDDRRTAVRVVDSQNVRLQGLTVDFDSVAGQNGVGSSKPIYGVLYWNTSGTVVDSTFENLAVPESGGGYYEIAFHARAPDRAGNRATVSLQNNTFRNVGRVAVNTHEYVDMQIHENTFESTIDDFGYAIELGSESTGAIIGNEISGFDTSAASDGSKSGGIYVENAFTHDVSSDLVKTVTVANNDVHDNTIGVQIGQGWDGLSKQTTIRTRLVDNHIHDNVDGVVLTDENAQQGSAVHVVASGNLIENNDRGYVVTTNEGDYSNGDGNITLVGFEDIVRNNDAGVHVSNEGPEAASDYFVDFQYSTFTDNAETVNNTVQWTTVDATLNWFGDARAENVSTKGVVSYDPFLTAPPAAVEQDPSALQQFAHDLEIPGDGQAYAVGFPAATENTLGEAFGDFDGVIWAYDAENESWYQPAADTPATALDAVVVVPDENTRVVIDLADAAPDETTIPPERDLAPGWNLVAAPQQGPAEQAFGASTAEPSRLVANFEQPGSQPVYAGQDFGAYTFGASDFGPSVSPFTGYWVYANEDGELAGAVPDGTTYTDEMGLLTTDAMQLVQAN